MPRRHARRSGERRRASRARARAGHTHPAAVDRILPHTSLHFRLDGHAEGRDGVAPRGGELRRMGERGFARMRRTASRRTRRFTSISRSSTSSSPSPRRLRRADSEPVGKAPFACGLDRRATDLDLVSGAVVLALLARYGKLAATAILACLVFFAGEVFRCRSSVCCGRFGRRRVTSTSTARPRRTSARSSRFRRRFRVRTRPIRSASLCASASMVIDEKKDRIRGSDGELAIAGPALMLGYWNRPEETARRFSSLLPASAGIEPAISWSRTATATTTSRPARSHGEAARLPRGARRVEAGCIASGVRERRRRAAG